MAYVNRENLIQLLAHENSNIEAGRQYYSAIYQKVMNMPTADVAEVKHAKWEINSDGYYPYCSNCKTEPKNGVMTKHCPECGALMDGGKEE